MNPTHKTFRRSLREMLATWFERAVIAAAITLFPQQLEDGINEGGQPGANQTYNSTFANLTDFPSGQTIAVSGPVESVCWIVLSVCVATTAATIFFRPFLDPMTNLHEILLRATNAVNALMALALVRSKWFGQSTGIVCTAIMMSLNTLTVLFSIYTMRLTALWAKLLGVWRRTMNRYKNAKRSVQHQHAKSGRRLFRAVVKVYVTSVL